MSKWAAMTIGQRIDHCMRVYFKRCDDLSHEMVQIVANIELIVGESGDSEISAEEHLLWRDYGLIEWSKGRVVRDVSKTGSV